MKDSKPSLQDYRSSQVVTNEFLNNVPNATEIAVKQAIKDLIENTSLFDLERIFNIDIEHTYFTGRPDIVDLSRKEIIVGYKIVDNTRYTSTGQIDRGLILPDPKQAAYINLNK